MEKKDYVVKKLQEKILEFNLQEKIESIPLSGEFIVVKYNDGSEDLVDPVAEFYLCKKYIIYFLEKYCYFIDAEKKKISGLKLFKFQKEIIIPSFLNNRFVITRKCLTENSYVETDRGYISIKDVKIGDKIKTIDKESNFVWDEITNCWKNEDYKPIVEIFLNNGSKLECTLDHKIMTNSGWKEAKDLSLEDELITNFDKDYFGNFELDNDEQAILIGYILTDGRNGNQFINTNENYINEALECGKKFKDISPHITKKNKIEKSTKQSYQVNFTTGIIGTNKSNSFLDFSRRFNLDKKSWNKELNNDLMNLNRRQMSIMLNRLYAGDGWATIGWRENPYGKLYAKFSIGFVSVNKTMIYQLQEILRKYGIRSYVKVRKAGRRKSTMNSYILYVSDLDSAIKFAKEIGIKDKINDSYIDFLEKNKKYSKKQSVNKIQKIRKFDNAITYDITTKNTNTFLANGVKVHNCRQTGLSVLSGLYALWVVNFNVAQEVVIISKVRKDAQDFKAKAMVTYERLPTFLKTRATRDGQNLTTLRLTNESRIIVKAQAEDAGRGITARLLILDEAAFMPYAEEIWASAYPSLTVSKGQCLVISTSNGVGNWYHQTWVSAENGENDFTPIYIPWWLFPGRDNPWLDRIENKDIRFLENGIEESKLQELKSVYTSNNDNYFKVLVEEFVKKRESEQLNYDGPKENKPWIKQQLDQLKIRKFNQEILSRFLGSGATVIDFKTLEKIEKELIRIPIYSDSLYGKEDFVKNLDIIETPKETTYTLVSDVSSGSGSDYSTIIVFRDDTLEQVAEYKAQIDSINFAKIIKNVAKFYNNAYVIIETNQGLSVFNNVFLDEKEPYENCFYEYKNKAYRGFHTGPIEKRLMIDEFVNCIESGVVKVTGKRTLEELKVFSWHNDKPEASKGYNDDLVICLMIISYMLKYSEKGKESGLGFATAKGTVNLSEKRTKEEIDIEKRYINESNVKDKIMDDYGIDVETYEWLTK